MRLAMKHMRSELDNWLTQRHGRDMAIIFTETKKVASYVWQSRKRGAMLVLVLAFSPILCPLVLFASFVGFISAVPLLCGAAAYYLIFRNTVLQVRGTVHLLLSAKWNSKYEQRNDEGTWSLNGRGDVFMAAALRRDGADVSSNELFKSSCRKAPAGGMIAFENESDVVEANRTFAPSSPSVTFAETNYVVQDRDKSFQSGEEQHMYSATSEAIEGEPVEGEPAAHVISSLSEKTISSARASVTDVPVRELLEEGCTFENFNEFSPDCKERSVSTSFFSDYTRPSDSSEQGSEFLSTRGTEYEDSCADTTSSSTAQYEEEIDLEPGAVSDSTYFTTPDESIEAWVSRRKRREEESTSRGRLAALSPALPIEACSMFNPLFEFESTPLPPLRKLSIGDKNHISNSPSFHTRFSKRHPAPRRTQTWSISGSTLSPRQPRVHECKSGVNVLENGQGRASCEACAQSREGEPTGRAGANMRSSLRLPWR